MMPLPPGSDAIPARATVGALQWAQRRVSGFEDFAGELAEWVRVAGDYGIELLVVPELITCQLLSAEPTRLGPAEALDRLSAHTPAWTALLSVLAKQHRLTLVGGTHLTWIDGRPRNVCWVATPRSGRSSGRRCGWPRACPCCSGLARATPRRCCTCWASIRRWSAMRRRSCTR